jgi:hypothetical protein
MDIDGLVVINVDNLHQNVYEYIQTKSMEVKTLDDILNVYTSMLQDGYCFVVTRDILMACLIDIMYVLNPSNDNKYYIKVNLSEYLPSDDEEDDD